MTRCRAARSISVIVLLSIAAFPQTQESPSQSADAIKAETTKLYGDTHPYLDAPLLELKKAVHELTDMTPASSQKQLPDLLDQIGAKADELLQRVPDLVSDEAVNQTQETIPKGQALGCVGLACTAPQPVRKEEDKTFQYRILTHPGAFGRVAHSEARITREGKSADPMMERLNFQGFLPAWILFYPVNQVESRFRYLGEQQIDGHSTFVIGFAQLPGSVASLDRPILLQGIAWVDQSDFRIVRLHTDLLAPIPEKKILKQTSDIVFGPVKLAQSHLQLWLPTRVDFEMEANGQFFHEEHKYSDYRPHKAAMDRNPQQTTPSSGLALSSAASGTKKNNEEMTETKLYAGAHPYMNESPSDLKKTVHELSGLTPAPSQDELSDLLAKTGARADDLLHKLPNLISDEEVSESHYSDVEATGCEGFGCIAPQGNVGVRDEMFHYMILTQAAHGARLAVSEYRTTRNDRPIGIRSPGAPSFQGFVSGWLVFSSANQVESQFRYLGQQRVNGHTTYVLGFAQTPGLVEFPGEIVVESGAVPMLLQGIAWIDQSDFRIVRLRTDLLAPLPQILIEKQTANILFGPVHIADLGAELWLPKAVSLQMEVRGQVVREEHNYSKYRLYQAKSRIMFPVDEPAKK